MSTHESYVSLETAKLLKEAGFDWNCISYHKCYKDGTNSLWIGYEEYAFQDSRYISPVTEEYSAPTLAVAQKWLREILNSDVLVLFKWGDDRSINYEYEIRREGRLLVSLINIMYSTYELALEAGIKKCLTLIVNKN